MSIKGTGRKVASKAGRTLQSRAATKNAKRVAASALSQRKSPKRKTSRKVASTAGRVLRNPKTTTAAKASAGSALAQARRKRKSKKRIKA